VTEALEIIQKAPREGATFDVVLACGFTPLHLRTFLRAHLQQRFPSRPVNVAEGLYGDVPGTLAGAAKQPVQAIALALEWPDLDPRLGFRSSGIWRTETELHETVDAALARLSDAILALPAHVRVAVSLPTTPLPPLFHTTGWQASTAELLLDQKLSIFAATLAQRRGLSFVNFRRLEEDSPPASRYDLRSDLLTGLPYTVAHADALAAALGRLLAPAVPKKGVITDLDDTLWDGILGDAGPEGVSWDLASHQHLHGLYQKMLAGLSEQGMLIGVASKNDPDLVDRVFQRPDLLLPRARVFPLEVHWNAKSGSVARILDAWNIGADSVVFVDDSPMELAEVAAAHPGIQCLRFPKGDYAATLAMLRELGDLAGKDYVSAEDALRAESIRQSADFRRQAADGAATETFLAQANARIEADWGASANDQRVLELVNKTNQFNLNGIRFTEADWQARLVQPGAFTVVFSYDDKFGPLGKIAVMQGTRQGARLCIAVWVMSCRAFSRRIEHQCLKLLFERFEAAEIRFEFAPTPRNGPLQQFFADLTGHPPCAPFAITREQFAEHCPPLYHQVVASREGA
jgi:FkbH-like protein